MTKTFFAIFLNLQWCSDAVSTVKFSERSQLVVQDNNSQNCKEHLPIQSHCFLPISERFWSLQTSDQWKIFLWCYLSHDFIVGLISFRSNHNIDFRVVILNCWTSGRFWAGIGRMILIRWQIRTSYRRAQIGALGQLASPSVLLRCRGQNLSRVKRLRVLNKLMDIQKYLWTTFPRYRNPGPINWECIEKLDVTKIYLLSYEQGVERHRFFSNF